MADIARKTRRYQSDLTDAEWERVAPLMPKPPRRGRKPAVDFREILNAIRYMARSAGGWRMMIRWRRLVHDYEKRLDVSEAMIYVAMGSLLLRRIAHR